MPLLAAGFVLLIAAANLANLLLARAAYRSREIAIRMAIGATQWRIVRGLLIESLLLAAVACVLAVGFSCLALTLSTSQAVPQLPYWRIKMDARLLATLAAIALVITGLFGLAPAVYTSRRSTAEGLKEGGRLSTPPKVLPRSSRDTIARGIRIIASARALRRATARRSPPTARRSSRHPGRATRDRS